jgi:uncharacterized protein
VIRTAKLFGLTAAVLAVCAVGTVALAAPKFPPLTGRVVDNAQLLSPATEAELTAELEALERQTGHQLVVATLSDLQGLEIEDYGYQLLRAWGIGRKAEDDGVILIVAPNQRQVRIEVGYGLEPVLTDALSSLIIQREILPAFRENRFEPGVVAGTRAIARQIGLPPEEAKAAVAQAETRRADRGASIDLPGIVFAIIVVLWVLGGVTRAFGGRRRGGSGSIWWLLTILSAFSGRGGGGSWGGGSGGGGFSGGGGWGGGGGASGRW